MPRKSQITDEELLGLLEVFFRDECGGYATKLKIPRFGEYVREHGFPEVQDTTIRRRELVRKRINQYIAEAEDSELRRSQIPVYNDLNIDAFLAKNNTEKKLKEAIRVREDYFKQLVASCGTYYRNANDAIKERTNLEIQIRNLQKEIDKQKERIQKLSAELKKEKSMAAHFRKYIETYVNPEIAQEVLAFDNTIKDPVSTHISKEAVDEKTLTADKKNPYTSNLVKGMFEILK